MWEALRSTVKAMPMSNADGHVRSSHKLYREQSSLAGTATDDDQCASSQFVAARASTCNGSESAMAGKGASCITR
jgi:hypothetical protein